MSRPDAHNRDSCAGDIAELRRRLNRERRARLEAERIAEQGVRDLYDKQRQLELLGKIAVAANESSSLPDTLKLALSLICQSTGWMLGHAYVCDMADRVRLTSAASWHRPDAEHLREFERVSEEVHFTLGMGLRGRVLTARAPQWIRDVTAEPGFARGEAAAAIGIKAGCAFPVLVAGEVVAVVELFSDQLAEPNELLLPLMPQIGTQIARVVERKHAADQLIAAQNMRFELDRRLLIGQAEDRLREQNARLDAALANMPHGLCMFDAEKRLVLNNSRYAEMYKLPSNLVASGTPLPVIVAYRHRQRAGRFSKLRHP